MASAVARDSIRVQDSWVLALEMTHVGLARVIDEGVLRFLSSSASVGG